MLTIHQPRGGKNITRRTNRSNTLKSVLLTVVLGTSACACGLLAVDVRAFLCCWRILALVCDDARA